MAKNRIEEKPDQVEVPEPVENESELKIPAELLALRLRQDMLHLKQEASMHNLQVSIKNAYYEFIQSCELNNCRVKYYKDSETGDLSVIPSLKQLGFTRDEAVSFSEPKPEDVEISAEEFYAAWAEQVGELDSITAEFNDEINELKSEIDTLDGDYGDDGMLLYAFYQGKLSEFMKLDEDMDYDEDEELDDESEEEIGPEIKIRQVPKKSLGFSTD